MQQNFKWLYCSIYTTKCVYCFENNTHKHPRATHFRLSQMRRGRLRSAIFCVVCGLCPCCPWLCPATPAPGWARQAGLQSCNYWSDCAEHSTASATRHSFPSVGTDTAQLANLYPLGCNHRQICWKLHKLGKISGAANIRMYVWRYFAIRPLIGPFNFVWSPAPAHWSCRVRGRATQILNFLGLDFRKMFCIAGTFAFHSTTAVLLTELCLLMLFTHLLAIYMFTYSQYFYAVFNK